MKRKAMFMTAWLLVAGIATALLLPARMHDAMFLGLVGIVSLGASFFWRAASAHRPATL